MQELKDFILLIDQRILAHQQAINAEDFSSSAFVLIELQFLRSQLLEMQESTTRSPWEHRFHKV